ncbi:MAG: type 4a pilus biogenesis protein PilO [Phycisphaerae bacterium]|nr:type 4a pilus biogenesis protein PilO [Tepidisphaeraceae bacterium]
MRTVKSQIAWCARAHWGLSIIMGGLLIAFVVFGWRPAWQRQRQLRAEIETASRMLSQNQTRTSSMTILQGEVLRLKRNVERETKKMPRTAELGEFIRDLTGQAGGLRKLVHQPGQVRRLDLYTEIPITMSFEGDFGTVFTFLRQVELMPRQVRIKNVTVRTRDPRQGVVDVNLALNIYFSEL